MQENLMILSESEEINSLLYKPIAATQRIKYTCLNVSINYIVLGSTSGSLYLFIREPCTFQQLIPLSEGPVTCVVISPDEKTIALATKRGSVCLIAVRPTAKLLAVSSEHLGEMVTSLCWNDNSTEIYIGDGIGKISTMVLSIFTVNGMFQAPSCALMNLDSTIVQMEFSSNLLLVSTMTRCYICDTSQEQFKQIGNKARDGEFGACFMKRTSPEERSPKNVRKIDRMLNRDTSLDVKTERNTSIDENNTKIYCARPGCRLWEVTTNGTVVKTHQFKDALAIPSSSIYRSYTTKISQNRHQIERTWSSQSNANFSHLHVVREKYLFSHTRECMCVIDPKNAAILLWTNDYADITMAITIDDRIYLMTENGFFHCLRLVDRDNLILDLYDAKRYNDCMRACKILKPEILRSTSWRNNRENDDNNGTNWDRSNDVTATLLPIISILRSNVDSQPVKLNSGIVVVNAGNGKHRIDDKLNYDKSIVDDSDTVMEIVANDREDEMIDTKDEAKAINDDVDTVIGERVSKKRQTVHDDSEISEQTDNCIDLLSKIVINDRTIDVSNDRENIDRTIDYSSREIDDVTLKIQTDLDPVYTMINSLKPTMTDDDMEITILRVRKTMSEINDNYGGFLELKDFLYEILRSTERHCYNVLLENLTMEKISETSNEVLLNEIVRSFVDTNISCIAECTCGYYYPEGNTREPKFLDIGKSLLVKFSKDDKRENCIKLCNSVTYMWRCYLPICIDDPATIDDVLCMCLRTRDNFVLSTILPMLDVRQWEIAVKCIRDMEMGVCPCCGRREENSNTREKMQIDWSGVARELMKREGTSSAMTFLVLVETVLPNVKLDKSIFQSLVFTKILDIHGLDRTVDFDKNTVEKSYNAMCSPKVQEQLLESLEKDLERPMEKNIFGTGAHHWGMRFQAKSSTCPCCTLSLMTPVLLGENGISLFPCGHAYHVNCLIQRKLTRCILHS